MREIVRVTLGWEVMVRGTKRLPTSCPSEDLGRTTSLRPSIAKL